ncbi:Root phototropism protein [Actinidia chinensis var. chinensis]|uniref:Root phototropism protein n=1 Tax=Actinidia chinensis var. chinensis TaxID=1590841 RepID=A0A2R6QFY3_ACTCC|nr:Root phototropism protein [Actinidia chinensis var. chinensis]
MKKLASPETDKPPQLEAECWFDDVCILDMDYFVKTLSGIRDKGVRPDLIGSIITQYASMWLPELSVDEAQKPQPTNFQNSPENTATASWTKKRFFVETLVGILPPEKDSIPCNFLLRLLRVANMVGAEPTYKAELEKRISWQLDQATLKEVMIPSFSHTCGTLLDVELVIRLVERFVNLDESVRGGAALVKVAKLVDGYLAEAHPGVSKQERKSLCKLMDSRKLSPEASLHAAQNERLPVRSVIQVLFSEQTKMNRYYLDWSGSFSGSRSPSRQGLQESTARCQSKREVSAQQVEIKRLRNDVTRLQSQCVAMQAQIERLLEKKSKGFFRWRKLGLGGGGVAVDVEEGQGGFWRQTPVGGKGKVVQGRTPKKFSHSMS